MFDDFATRPTDTRRFGASLAASVGIYLSIGAGIVIASTVVREVLPDDLVQLEFRAPEAPPPPPPPPPPPIEVPVEAMPSAPARLGRPRTEPVMPTEVPTERPPESDAPLPPADPFANEPAGDPNGTPDGVPGGVGHTVAAAPAAAPPPPPPPPPRASGPMRVPEGGTPPRPLDGNRQPEIPSALRSSGLAELRVVVRVVVDEEGRVTQCTVLRGHELMPESNLIAAISTWRFSPARTSGGEPFSAIHTLPLTFRLQL